MINNLVQYQIKSPSGALFLVASSRALQGVYWRKQAIAVAKVLDQSPGGKILQAAQTQLDEYFAGKRRRFDLPLELTGTAFQVKVWKELIKIPFGQTISYTQLARQVKNPRACRAVGSANGKNPLCIIVPCHRVIAADGAIGGYSGGIAQKRQLLELEQR